MHCFIIPRPPQSIIAHKSFIVYFQAFQSKSCLVCQHVVLLSNGVCYSSKCCHILCLQLRNPTESFNFATVKNSAIEEYFKRQVEFTTMYRTMENENFDTVEDAIFAVENGQVYKASLNHESIVLKLLCLSSLAIIYYPSYDAILQSGICNVVLSETNGF